MKATTEELYVEAVELAGAINERLDRFVAYPGLDIKPTKEARISITVEGLRALLGELLLDHQPVAGVEVDAVS